MLGCLVLILCLGKVLVSSASRNLTYFLGQCSGDFSFCIALASNFRHHSIDGLLGLRLAPCQILELPEGILKLLLLSKAGDFLFQFVDDLVVRVGALQLVDHILHNVFSSILIS